MVDGCWPGSDPRATRAGSFQIRRTGGARAAPHLCRGTARRRTRPPVRCPGSTTSGALVISRPVRRIAQAAVVTSLVAGAVRRRRTLRQVRHRLGRRQALHGPRLRQHRRRRPREAGHPVGAHDVVVPAAAAPGQRRPEDRRPLRPQADRHRRRRAPVTTGRPRPPSTPPCRSSASAPTPPSCPPRARSRSAARASPVGDHAQERSSSASTARTAPPPPPARPSPTCSPSSTHQGRRRPRQARR